jgi:hypothetical protein
VNTYRYSYLHEGFKFEGHVEMKNSWCTCFSSFEHPTAQAST